MRRIFIALILSSAFTTHAFVQTWTNTLGGDWANPTNWSPHSIPQAGDIVNITVGGTYNVSFTNTAGITLSALNIGAGAGSQTLIYGCSASLLVTNNATISANGVLAITNGGLAGNVTVLTNGALQLSSTASKFLYGLNLTNQGTVVWSGGFLEFSSTIIINSGLWKMTSDDSIVLGGSPSFMINSGVFRKSAGTGTSSFNNSPFFNQAGALIDCSSGTLLVAGGGNCVLGGTLNATAPGTVSIGGGTWFESGAIATGTGTNQFVSGTLNLVSNTIPGLQLTGGNIAIVSAAFQQAGAITNMTLDGAVLTGTNIIGGGTLTFNSGGIINQLTILPAGQLVFATAVSKTLYTSTILNQGTVTWNGGLLSMGSTIISNGGLWLMTGDNNETWGGANLPVWTNSGILRKTGAAGNSVLQGMNFINQPGGLVDGLSGTILLGAGSSNVLAGTLNATLPGAVTINGGTWTDAGGVTTGTGVCQFSFGTFNLRTNVIPGLALNGGDLYVTGTNTFQQGGVITNLTMNGAVLHGTNTLAGVLTYNSGNLTDQLNVGPTGQLLLNTTTSKGFYNLNLFNQGTVIWNNGQLSFGSTIISNGGVWQMTTDNAISWGGYNIPIWTNSGTLRKTGGTGTSVMGSMTFVNQTKGVVQSDSGTLALPYTTTNTAGALRLNGGAISGLTSVGFTGGTLDGTGSVGSITPTGGTITPGENGPGTITFTSDLSLAPGVTVVINGTGTTPGTQYDQLNVIGAVSLSNATLQVTSLPAVPVGTTFTIIVNDGADAVSGTFNGLPENGLVNGGGQPFRIHYAGGTGNDVTLVREAGEQLTNGISGGGNFTFTGVGSGPGTYTVQATTNLINWANIGTGTADASGHFTFIDTNAAQYPWRFYRTTN